MSRRAVGTEPGCVTLYPEDWVDVDAVARRNGAVGRSAGLRALIQEWRALTRTMTHLTYIPTGVAQALQEGSITVATGVKDPRE